MADFDSSLPIRSEADGADERVHVKIVDKDNPDTQQATVDADSNVKVGVYGDKSSDASDVALQLSEEGRPNPRGDYHASENAKPASVGMVAHSRGASIDETSQLRRVTAVPGSDNTVAMDVALRDEAGQAFSQTNPLPVSLAESEGTEVVNYSVSSAVAQDVSSDQDYTVTALKTLVIDRLLCAASGKAKFELKIETGVATGTFNTKAVWFNSTANPSGELSLSRRLVIPAGVIVRITATNRDNQPQDLYTTLIGVER